METKKISSLIKRIKKFNDSRGWKPVPQDVAKSIVLEAAELLEHFQWDEGKTDLVGKDMTEIKYEVADVFWYLVIFCHRSGIDLAEAIEMKMIHNEEKYPLVAFAGQHNQEFYMAQKKKYRELKKAQNAGQK
ncbi:MAG TPA: nucleotide pyrophosphohydrolase [Patescibacteria group bacterium]